MKRKVAKSSKKAVSEKDDVYFSRSVSKAFEIIGILGKSPMPLTLNQVATATSLTKSFAYRMLRTLQSLGYVQHLSDNLFTVPADNFIVSSERIRDVVDAAKEPMQQLHMRFRETISLAATLGNRIEVLAVLDSPHLVRMTNSVGRILPPHASSLGKAIMAFQTPEQQRRLLGNYGLLRLTDSTIVDELKLNAEYEQIRQLGLSHDDEESILHAFCIGAPIRDNSGAVVAGVSISMPKIRVEQNQELITEIGDALIEHARTISERLSNSAQLDLVRVVV